MKHQKIPPAQLAEQAGNNTGHRALASMRQCPTQRGRLEILIEAMVDIQSASSGQEGAIKGFAVALIATLDHGMGLQK